MHILLEQAAQQDQLPPRNRVMVIRPPSGSRGQGDEKPASLLGILRVPEDAVTAQERPGHQQAEHATASA
jgi:hypothetical protein